MHFGSQLFLFETYYYLLFQGAGSRDHVSEASMRRVQGKCLFLIPSIRLKRPPIAIKVKFKT